jgi:NAD(P)-dependent dehydrogenase (short-subunit alcohol dehydrogenase family)
MRVPLRVPMRSVVVTGTSTGIGWGAAKALIGQNFRVFGSVRKRQDAERLSAELGENFTPLVFDVTDEAAVYGAAAQVRDALAGGTLSGLVNNAGISVPGPLLELPIEDFRRQFEVNLIGVVTVTQAFAPLLGTDRQLQGKPGRIVNISSVGGRTATPFLAPYNASKFALEGLSESLRRELLLFGIDVIVVGPGAVVTAIWDKAEKIDLSAYLATPYGPALQKLRDYMLGIGRKGLPPEQLGAVIAQALTAPHPKTRYAVTPQPFQDFLGRTLPARWLDRLIGRQLGLLPALRRA